MLIIIFNSFYTHQYPKNLKPWKTQIIELTTKAKILQKMTF